MPERKRLSESPSGHLLVGLFVVVAVAGFTWLLIALRQGPERYPLVAEFETLGDISEATQVKLRGFTVGKVDGIDFRPSPPEGEPFFLVRLGIRKGYPVPEGTIAEIRGSGLVGEAYVLLDVTGAAGPTLAPGAHLPGRSDEAMKTLVTKVRDAAHKLGQAGGAIRDARLGERLGGIGADVSRIAEGLGRVSDRADSLLLTSRGLVAGMEPGVLHSVESLDRSMAQLAVTMARTDTLMAAVSRDVRASVRTLRDLVERLEAVVVRVDTLVQRKQGEIDETLANVHATSAALRKLSERPWQLIAGRGDGRVAEEMEATGDGE